MLCWQVLGRWVIRGRVFDGWVLDGCWVGVLGGLMLGWRVLGRWVFGGRVKVTFGGY